MIMRNILILLLVIIAVGCLGQAQDARAPQEMVRFEEIRPIGPDCYSNDAQKNTSLALCPVWGLGQYSGSLSVEGMIVEQENDTRDAPLAIYDLDKDGRQEIIISAADMIGDERWANQVKAISPSGMLIWYVEISGEKSTRPEIYDIDNDGQPEILIGTDNGTVYAIGPNGTVEWSYETGKAVESIETEKDPGTRIRVTTADGTQVLDPEGGLLEKRKKEERRIEFAVTGKEGENRLIIAAEKEMLRATTPEGETVWEYRTGMEMKGAPLAADVNNDGKKEIIAVSDGIYVLDEKGKPVNFTLYGQEGFSKGHYRTSAPVHAMPAIADLDLDGTPEIITITSEGDEVILSASRSFLANNPGMINFNGKISPAPTMIIEKNSPYASAPAISDMNGDGYPDRIYFIPDQIVNKNGRQVGSSLLIFYTPTVKPITEPAVNLYSEERIGNSANEKGYAAEYIDSKKEVILTIEGEDSYVMQYDGILSELEKKRVEICQETERISFLPYVDGNRYKSLLSGTCALENRQYQGKGHEIIFMKEKIEKGKKKEIRIPVKAKPVEIRLLVIEDVLNQECAGNCDALDEKWYSLGNVKYINIGIV